MLVLLYTEANQLPGLIKAYKQKLKADRLPCTPALDFALPSFSKIPALNV